MKIKNKLLFQNQPFKNYNPNFGSSQLLISSYEKEQEKRGSISLKLSFIGAI